MNRLLISLALVPTLAACDALVGGACAEGYVVSDGRCVPAPQGTSEGGGGAGFALATAGGGDGPGAGSTGSGGQSACAAPLASCGDLCVDLDHDPEHCGVCGNLCPSGICDDGSCVGDPAGHAVIIGTDYASSTPATRKMLGNAVFLPFVDPVPMLEYREHVPVGTAPPVSQVIDQQADLRGRTVAPSLASSAAEAASKLDTGSHRIFLVHDQPLGSPEELADAAATLAPAVDDFTEEGGIVVVLVSDAGDGMTAFLSGLGFVDVTSVEPIDGVLDNLVPTDAIGAGLPTQMVAPSSMVALPLDGGLPSPWVGVVAHQSTGEPVTLHRVFMP